MKKSSYLSANIKRNIKLFPKIIIPVLTMGLIFAFIGSLAVTAILKSENRQAVKIGLVGNTKGTYLGFGIDAIEKYDTSKYEIDFVRLDKISAKKKLKNRKISAYIIVPEDFTNKLIRGKKPNLIYVSNKSDNNLSAKIIKEIAAVISNSLSPAEAGIYSMRLIAQKYGYSKSEINRADTEIGIKYIFFVLNRNCAFAPTVLGVSDGLSSEEYYFCAVIFFFLSVLGVIFIGILKQQNCSYIAYMKSRGIGYLKQIACEYLSYFTVTAIIILSLFAAGSCIIELSKTNIEGFLGITARQGLFFAIKIMPALFMITVLQFMLYELIDSVCGAIIAQFVSALIFSYLAGCFYPIDFFPPAYRKIENILPNTAGFSYIRQSFKGVASPITLITVLFYAAAFFGISVYARKSRAERSVK